jgi:hypothetical protein
LVCRIAIRKGPCGGAVIAIFAFDYENSGNSGSTPPVAQDFRGERDAVADDFP